MHIPWIDRQLFTTRAMMIYYWIAKRHPVHRVMKQFSLRQVIPLEFLLPYEQIDGAHKSRVDYVKSFSYYIRE